MSKIKGKDTRPEVLLRSAFWRAGLRFRKNYGPYKIDVAFPGARVAVFFDSCFWHGCPRHGTIPKTNTEFWRRKLRSNLRRDREATKALKAGGWSVFRVWEHERRDMEQIARRVRSEVLKRSPNRAR